MHQKKIPHKKRQDTFRIILIGFAMAFFTCVVYWQVGGHDFIAFDDPAYVTDNPTVKNGFSSETISWAFTAMDVHNWHPLTWLSHMLDVEWFGLDPGGHHRTNVFIHALNSMVLLFVLYYMTGALWRSAFVAALFALHPLHVESVAWVSERKDVLSTFFLLLTVAGYARYVKRRTVRSYLLCCLFFLLGLMSKPMLVTLPFALLLLDIGHCQYLHHSLAIRLRNLRPGLYKARRNCPFPTIYSQFL